MNRLTQKQVIEQQSQILNTLTNRLLEIEILLASITDLITEKGIIDKNDLEVIIKEKVEIVKERAEIIKSNSDIETIESFPYFGKPGEA